MKKFSPVVAIIILSLSYSTPTLSQSTVATLANRHMTFPIKVDTDYYTITLKELWFRQNHFEVVSATRIVREPKVDTAVFTADNMELLLPSLLKNGDLLTDVRLQLSNQSGNPFRLGNRFTLTEFNEAPDVIFFNGAIITMEKVRPQVSALAISGATIVATGSDSHVLAFRRHSTKLVDLHGLTVMPGFVDPHNHAYHPVFYSDVPWPTYKDAQQAFLAAGITTMGDPGVTEDFLNDFLPFARSDRLRIRTSLYLSYNNACGDLTQPSGWWRHYPPIKNPRARLRFPGLKVIADGGSCNNGAFVFLQQSGDLYFTDLEKNPWPNPPQMGWLPQDAINEAAANLEAVIREAQDAGYQTATHALGDIAIDATLLAIQNALNGGPNTPRHRIEHNRFIRPDQLPKYGEVGAIPVVFGQPFTCPIIHNGPWSFLNNQPVLQSWLDPWRALIDANPSLPVAWKSDALNNFPLEPMTHLWSLVTRNEYGYLARDTYVSPPETDLCEAPEWLKANAVTVEEALRMMTINAAYALFMDQTVGSLRTGKFADVIVLSENPQFIDPNEIVNIKVLMTMIGGHVEYCGPQQKAYCP